MRVISWSARTFSIHSQLALWCIRVFSVVFFYKLNFTFVVLHLVLSPLKGQFRLDPGSVNSGRRKKKKKRKKKSMPKNTKLRFGFLSLCLYSAWFPAGPWWASASQGRRRRAAVLMRKNVKSAELKVTIILTVLWWLHYVIKWITSHLVVRLLTCF